MALLTASMSLRKTRANRMIGMMSESIASSIQGSSVSDLLLRRIPLKRIARRRISANASDPCFRASTFLACRGVSRPLGFMHSAAATTGEIAWPVSGSRTGPKLIAIEGTSSARTLFGPPPSSQQSLQIGEAAGVAALLDIKDAVRSGSLPSSIGQGTFQSTMVMWGSMLLAAYLAEP